MAQPRAYSLREEITSIVSCLPPAAPRRLPDGIRVKRWEGKFKSAEAPWNRRLPVNTSEKKLLVGIDIGGTKTAVLLSVNPAGGHRAQGIRHASRPGPERAVELIKSGIRELLAEQGVEAMPSSRGWA